MSARPWINYHHLFYFKTIASEGGLAKAAEKLRIGQPTLSTQMQQFENVIGHQLFDRSKRQLQLTEAGRMMLGYANEIFRLGDEMVDSLLDQHVTQKVHVQIGAMDTVPKHLALRVFEHARGAHNCVVLVAEGHGDELFRELRAHRLDLVISNHQPAHGEASGFYLKNIARMPVAVYGAKKFAKLSKGFPESLRGQPFIMPSTQSKVRHDVDHYLRLQNIQVDTIAETQDSSLQILLGVHGHGLLPLAAQDPKKLFGHHQLTQIGVLPDVHEELWLIAAERRIQNPVAADLMRSFKI